MCVNTAGTLQVYKKLFADKNKKLAGVPFAYVVQPTASCSSASSSSTNGNGDDKKEPEQTTEERLDEYIFEKKVDYAAKLLSSKKVQEFDDLSRVRVLLHRSHRFIIAAPLISHARFVCRR
jgi:hypothetical protein